VIALTVPELIRGIAARYINELGTEDDRGVITDSTTDINAEEDDMTICWIEMRKR